MAMQEALAAPPTRPASSPPQASRTPITAAPIAVTARMLIAAPCLRSRRGRQGGPGRGGGGGGARGRGGGGGRGRGRGYRGSRKARLPGRCGGGAPGGGARGGGRW